ncbi:MAG: hemolysin family protein [Candidatus Zixiibacteriota bacterium]
MLIELVLTIAGLLACLGAIYSIASVAIQILTLDEITEEEVGHLTERRRRLLQSLTGNTHEVLLAADLFKSLVFLLMALLVVWMVPRWLAGTGWQWVPVLAVVLVGVWILRVLVGEVLPKATLSGDPQTATLSGLTRLAIIWWAFRPILVLVRSIVRRRVVAARRPTEDREEIVERAIESLARSAGLDEPMIEEDEREMIQGVIGLEATEVREVMVPRVAIVALPSTAGIEDVRRVTSEHGHSRIPIYDDDLDSIIGILYIKDVFIAVQTAADVDLARLARDAFVVPETKRVDALLEEFKKRQTHVAIVVDEFGGTAGLVTLEDILEEIVGEIQDEHDLKPGQIEEVGEGEILVDGVVPLYEIADALDISLPDERFETIGGLIYDRVGGVPEVGQTVEEHGLRIRIEEKSGQRISRVRVTKIARDRESVDNGR